MNYLNAPGDPTSLLIWKITPRLIDRFVSRWESINRYVEKLN